MADECLGEYTHENDFDCGYEHAGEIVCENCIYGPAPSYGIPLTDLYDPETGKHMRNNDGTN